MKYHYQLKIIRFVNKFTRRLGYKMSQITSNPFEIAGIKYVTNPGSIGETPQGEIIAQAAFRIIQEQNYYPKKILDLACGNGIIGLTLYQLLERNVIVGFADINFFNVIATKQTCKINKLAFSVYLSDGLQNVKGKYDLIICNPPNFEGDESHLKALDKFVLGNRDYEWQFHRDFYSHCHLALNQEGRTWLFEVKRVGTKIFTDMIKKNPMMKLTNILDEPTETNFNWLMAQRSA